MSDNTEVAVKEVSEVPKIADDFMDKLKAINVNSELLPLSAAAVSIIVSL